MVDFTEANIQRLFGHEAAENEDAKRLKEYYFKSSVYDRIVSDLPIRILVGHKGIGKSALLKIAILEDNSKKVVPVLIKPDDIIDLGVDTNDILHTIRNWRDGLVRIIVSKVLDYLGLPYHIDKVLLTNFRGSINNQITEMLLNIKSSDYPSAKLDDIWCFLEKPKITVYLDDLDRGWQGRREDVVRISALLNAVRDISSENKDVYFRIALRSDVYFLVRTSDESTDKIEGSVIWQSWTHQEIFVMLIKRIETFFERAINEDILLNLHQSQLSSYLTPIMNTTYRGRGKWENVPTYKVLMSLIRKRPRDLVKLCTLAARHANSRKSNIIQAEDFEAIFEVYSQGRIRDTVNEYKHELPDLERLLMNMKPNKKERTAKEGYVYRTDALLDKLSNIMQQGNFTFANKKMATTTELAAFLYKINFLTARKLDLGGKINRKYFEENNYLSSQFVDFGFDWEVHMAYRWALQPSDMNNYLTDLSEADY